MSYNEAIEDGVRFSKKGYSNVYYPKCCICGEETMSPNYIRDNKYTCKKCKFENYIADKEEKTNTNIETKEKKFKNALRRLEGTRGCSYRDYERAIDIIHDKLHRDGWFDSTEEIMVAIELVKNNIKARHQVKFGRYRADFVLPEEKVVLEVDGVVFHTEKTREKEKLRDSLIVLSLGPDWEVLRITDENINKNIKRLLPAIKKIKEKREIYRRYNNGSLPEWYNDRN